jgi:hypothetical protein
MSILLTRQAWHDQQVIDYFAAQLEIFFSGVAPRHERRLLQLSLQSNTAQIKVAEQLRRLHEQTESIAIDLLALELRKVAGYAIDPRTALLHTRAPRSRRAAEQGHAVVQGPPKTLWEAALDSFGFDISHGTGSGLAFTDNSYLTDATGARLTVIKVSDVVRIVRDLDLGMQIALSIGTQIKTSIASVLQDHCEAQVQFDLIHGHCVTNGLLSAQELDDMLGHVVDADTHWTRYHLKSGSQALDTPFFILDLQYQEGDPVYCYCPDRPGGAWRRHPSLQSATDSLLQQIRDSAEAGNLDWLLRQLSLRDQQRLASHLKAPRQNLQDFNWLAKQLYTVFADERPPTERMTIEARNLEVKSLTQAVQDHQALRFYSDLTGLATSTAAADRKTLARGFEFVVSETLEMILLPLPGGLLGAGKLVMVAMLGSLAYQTASAFLALQDGESAGFIQAMSDIFDLLISARLNGVGARLSAQRSRQLMAQLRNPRKVGDTGQQTISWAPAAEAPAPRADAADKIPQLRRMLPTDSAPLADEVLERCLKLTPLTAAGLEAIWNATTTTPQLLADLLIGEQLRSEFDALSQALDTDGPLPPLANSLMPALLARQLNVRLSIHEQHSQRYHASYSGDQVAAPVTELVITHLGHRRYRAGRHTRADAGQSLFAAIIEAYDRQVPDNQAGKIGDFSADAQAYHRAQVLRGQVRARLTADWHGLFQQGLAQRFEQNAPREPAHDGPPLARSRAANAMATLADSQGRGAPMDAAHLTFAMLVTLPGWPAELGINLYKGSLDRNGLLQVSPELIQSYGEPSASTFIHFAHLGTRFAGVDQSTQEMIQMRATEYAVNDLVLRTLTDSQRNILGYGLGDGARLGQAIGDLAMLERSDLLAVFPEPTRIDLGAARLEPYLASIDLGTQQADAQGLYRLGNALYVRIGTGIYRVLHDHEASSPSLAVMRIVHGRDAVANAPDNRYIGTRFGNSEPIAQNSAGEWQGIVIGLAGGQPPKRQGRRVPHATRMTRKQADDRLNAAVGALRAAEQALEPAAQAMHQADLAFQRAEAADLRGSTARTQAALLAATRARIPLMPPLLLKRMKVFNAQNTKAKVLDDYLTTVLASDHATRHLHKGEYQGLCLQRIISIDQIVLLNILMATAVTEPLRDNPALYPDEFIKHREIHLQMLEKNRLLALQREADVLALRGPWATPDVEARLAQIQPENPATAYYIRLAQLQFHGDILAIGTGSGPLRFDFRVADLTTQFRENAVALKTVDEIVPEQRIALLDGIEREFENQHQAMLQLSRDYAPGPRRERAERMVEIAQEFETMSRARLTRELLAQSDQKATERLGEDLDLDFLPRQAGPRPQPAKPRKRVIRIRRRGLNTIAVGEVRDAGRTIAVVSPENGSVVQTYRQDAGGTWQLTTSTSAAVDIQVQRNEATARLSLVQTHIDKARQMHARKDNPTNIVEMLERHADALRELIPSLPALADDLHRSATQLSELGRTLMIERYKDPSILDVHRLRFLMEANEVEVYHATKRLARGRGQNRYYLDVYEIRDGKNLAELWHAHFHYPRADSPNDDYPLRGGHLKTLEQSRLGREHQAQQEQAGLPIERIWRQEIDRDTARKLFAKATPGE